MYDRIKVYFLRKEACRVIQIDLVDYDRLTSVGMQVTQYVNSNLRDIIRVLIDILETDPGFELDGFFPRDYLERKPPRM